MPDARADYNKAVELGLTNLDRWSNGIDHHPQSERLVRFLAEHDFHDYSDLFCWKIGGDGDNGEALMYQADAFFEMLEGTSRNESGEVIESKASLEANMIAAEKVWLEAKQKLNDFKCKLELHTYDSIGQAIKAVEKFLLKQANEDCEIAGDQGAEEYTQQFVVQGFLYEGKLVVEYNRHDKKYYYVDSSTFTFVAVKS